ncbi:hypothetical protein N9N28_16085 [Rubripirellula amarantea]|nr:hypothetical protein [Rubripirellula amarantea]
MLNPIRWTMLTWFAALLWLYGAIPMNIPPSVTYTQDAVTGQLGQPTTYDKLEDYPFPIGWPLHYVEPDDPALWNKPIPFTGLPIAPGPSRVSYTAVAVNAFLIVATLASLVFLLQTYLPRFSVLSLLLLPALVSLYILGARIIARGIGYNAYWYYESAIYFSPLLLLVFHSLGGQLPLRLPPGKPAEPHVGG